MTDRIGGDLSRMDELKAQFDKESGEIERLIGTLDGWVNNTIGPDWFGPAAERFAAEWQGEYKGSLTRMREALMAASAEVQARRDALLQAGG